MKKLLLILLFSSNFSFAQEIELRLVNSTIGSPLFNYTTNGQTESNDPNLNVILQTYGVNWYVIKYGHPYPAYYEKIINVSCNPSNSSQLIAALQSYSSVVSSATLTAMGQFNDALHVGLLNANVGQPTGISNNVVTTNDSGLNQIFLNNNVYYYSISPYGYDLVCNCNSSSLKTILDNYSSVIAFTDNVTATYLLDNSQFQKTKTIISPNPFSDSFNIETENIISNYSLFDISGKQIVSTNLKAELDSKSQQLNSGFYFLNLTFDNGQIANYKLVKK